MEESEIYGIMSREKPCFIFIADIAWFVKMVYSTGTGIKDILENLIEREKFWFKYIYNIRRYFLFLFKISNILILLIRFQFFSWTVNYTNHEGRK